MSKGVNKVILIGNLGQDPEVRSMPNGNTACNFTMATSDSWKDKSTGEQKERTEWHRVSMFGKLAEISGQYLKKGSKVYIEGSLRTRKWQDNQGQDRYTTEIVVDINGQMQMLDGKTERSTPDGPKQHQPDTSQKRQQPPTQQKAPSADDYEDDIPFN